MWRALRTEVAYFRPWLLGGIGIAAGVVVILSTLIRISGDQDGPPLVIFVMFPVIAGMVVSFIAQSLRAEERRSRLLLAGALTPRQLATVMVLLPISFVGLTVLVSPVLIGLGAVIAGKLEWSALGSVGGFAVQFLAYAQLGPLAKESSAARRQQRYSAATVGWVIFGGIILVLAASQFFFGSVVGQLAQAAAVVVVMAAAWLLYQGRTDFTS
jgi:hypothetical protein